MTTTIPLCPMCKHVISFIATENITCRAFPEGIPEVFVQGELAHTEPYPDADNPQDNGIRFEPIEDTE